MNKPLGQKAYSRTNELTSKLRGNGLADIFGGYFGFKNFETNTWDVYPTRRKQ